jgi:hypothetical protein
MPPLTNRRNGRRKALPEIMLLVTCTVNELSHQKVIVDRVYAEVCAAKKVKIPHLYSIMIEIPRVSYSMFGMDSLPNLLIQVNWKESTTTTI